MADEAVTDDVRLPNRCDVWRQVKYDLFETKDVQDNPTFSYTWIADQGGHFSLGFLPTYLISWIVAVAGSQLSWDTTAWNVWIGAGVFGIWVVKELNDLRLAIRNARRSKSDFRFNFWELLKNIGTAWLFFAMGSAVAALSFVNTTWALLSLGPVILITLGVSYWWLRRKITFQQSGLPYLYRLATFPNNIPKDAKVGMGLDSAKEFIGKLIVPGSNWSGHLILTGVPNAGKTTLAVAIGTEYVFQLGLARYLSLVKLLQFTSPNQVSTEVESREVRINEEFDDGRILWRWNKVGLLIVDDVDDVARVEHDGKEHTPEEVKAYNERVAQVLTVRLRSIILDLQSRRRTVWVCNDPVSPEALKGLLESQLKYENVQIIKLEKSMALVRIEKQLV